MRDMELQRLQAQAAELQARIDAELKAREALLALTPTQQLAVYMRENTMLRDDDSWYYEIPGGVHNWSGSTHAHWLVRAQRLMHVMREATKEEGRVLADELFVKDAMAAYMACVTF